MKVELQENGIMNIIAETDAESFIFYKCRPRIMGAGVSYLRGERSRYLMIQWDLLEEAKTSVESENGSND